MSFLTLKKHLITEADQVCCAALIAMYESGTCKDRLAQVAKKQAGAHFSVFLAVAYH